MAERAGRAQQVILLCLLALCVAAMHHVPASSGGPDPTTTSVTAESTGMPDMDSGEHHAPDGAHGMLHLCLAVLTAIGALLLAWVLLVRRPGTGILVGEKSSRGSPVPERPPDRRGRTVLNSLCVLRV